MSCSLLLLLLAPEVFGDLLQHRPSGTGGLSPGRIPGGTHVPGGKKGGEDPGMYFSQLISSSWCKI